MKGDLEGSLPVLPEGFLWRISKADGRGFCLSVVRKDLGGLVVSSLIRDPEISRRNRIEFAAAMEAGRKPVLVELGVVRSLTDSVVLWNAGEVMQEFKEWERRDALRKEQEAAVEASMEYVGDYVPGPRWRPVKWADLRAGDMVRVLGGGLPCANHVIVKVEDECLTWARIPGAGGYSTLRRGGHRFSQPRMERWG